MSLCALCRLRRRCRGEQKVKKLKGKSVKSEFISNKESDGSSDHKERKKIFIRDGRRNSLLMLASKHD